MNIREAQPRISFAHEPLVGSKPVTPAEIKTELGDGRVIAQLSQASLLREKGEYWVGHEEIATFADPNHRYYINNTDGAYKDLEKGFVKVSDKDFFEKYPWSVKVLIQKTAVEKALRGEGPLVLKLGSENDEYKSSFGRMTVNSEPTGSLYALLPSVLRVQTSEEVVGVFYKVDYKSGQLKPAALTADEAKELVRTSGVRLLTLDEAKKLARGPQENE